MFKTRTNHKKRFGHVLLLTLFLIVFLTLVFLKKFNSNITPSILSISEEQINKITYYYITDLVDNDLLNTDTLEDILIIAQDEDGVVTYVDFNLDKAYKVLDSIGDAINEALNDLENGSISINYYDYELSSNLNSLVISIPLGAASDSLYFYNLGPKIPVKINFSGSVLTNLSTKITNYGLNNALVEMFVYIKFKSNIMAPFATKEIELEYDTLIASMVINGKVPSIYGGSLTSSSVEYESIIK